MNKEVADWLKLHGFDRFVDEFEKHEIDAEVLPDLSVSDLLSMQIPLGPAKKLHKALAALAPEPRATTPDLPQLPAPVSEPERRQVTIMFCDMVGSTALSSRFDPEDLSTIVLNFLECCTNTAQRYDAHIARYMGDGLLVYFGYPQARENDAERAVRVALEIIRNVKTLEPLPGVSVSARVGIATGMVVGGESIGEDTSRESVVMGDTPNLAARLQEQAEPNTVLVSEVTKRLAGSMFTYHDEGTHSFKGFIKPIRIFKVAGQQHVDSRFNSAHENALLPLIGREHELALVLARHTQACNGEGQVVVISAEAGLGKSRIARAAVDAITSQQQRVISLQCSPYYDQSALYPIEQYLIQASGIQSSDIADDSYRKLKEELTHCCEFEEEYLGVITQMFGLGQQQHPDIHSMPAQQRHAKLMDALNTYLLNLSEQLPLVVLIEDTHWIDPTSRTLLELLIESIEYKRVLIIATERPNGNDQHFDSPITSRLKLNRLSRPEVKRMIASIAEEVALSNDVMNEIAGKTDGVPLYIEELTKAAIESGQFDNDNNDSLQVSINKLAIPSSLHDSLMERLDRLSVVKEYAQVSSVLGREFDQQLLAATLDRPHDEITEALQQLVTAGLMSCAGQPPRARYTFKHSLIRDTAYESMLKRRRQHWHSRVAVALESKFPNIVESEPEILAMHYQRCGFADKAIQHWAAASDLSLSQFNLHEALEKANNGLSLAGQADGSSANRHHFLKLHMVRALALRSLNGFGDQESANAFKSAIELALDLQDLDRYGAAARGLCVSLYMRGKLAQARDIAEQLTDKATEPRRIVDSHLTLGQVLYYIGDPHESRKHLYIALEHIEKLNVGTELSQQFDERCAVEQFLCTTLDLMGSPDNALEFATRAWHRARDLHQPLAVAGTLCHLCLLKLRLKLPCLEESAILLSHSNEYKMPFWRAWADFCSAMAENNEPRITIKKVEAARKSLQSQGVRLGLSAMMTAEVQLLLDSNMTEDAMRCIEDTHNYIDDTGERYYLPELHRISSQVHLKLGNQNKALIELEHALQIADQQKAYLWQLRAATALVEAGGSGTRLQDLLNTHQITDYADINRAKRALENAPDTRNLNNIN